MQAILLAGGLGTRLKSVVNDRPKPMAPIEGLPFMFYLVSELKRQGIDKIIFAVGYKGSMVEEYFKDGKELGIQAAYAYEEELLGTAGAIKNAGRLVTEDEFFVLNADTFYQINYQNLINDKDMDMMIVLRRTQDASRYGRAVLSEERLVAFNEKVSEKVPGIINGGIYRMKRCLLDEIPEGKVSLENDMIPNWLAEGKKIGGIVSDGYFIDIGVPEDYFKFTEDVKKGVVKW